MNSKGDYSDGERYADGEQHPPGQGSQDLHFQDPQYQGPQPQDPQDSHDPHARNKNPRNKNLRNKNRSLLLVLFVILLAGAGTIGIYLRLGSDEPQGDRQVFCELIEESGAEIGTPEAPYEDFVEVAPREIRDTVEDIRDSTRNLQELRQGEDLAAYFLAVFGDERVVRRQNRVALSRYVYGSCAEMEVFADFYQREVDEVLQNFQRVSSDDQAFPDAQGSSDNAFGGAPQTREITAEVLLSAGVPEAIIVQSGEDTVDSSVSEEDAPPPDMFTLGLCWEFDKYLWEYNSTGAVIVQHNGREIARSNTRNLTEEVWNQATSNCQLT